MKLHFKYGNVYEMREYKMRVPRPIGIFSKLSRLFLTSSGQKTAEPFIYNFCSFVVATVVVVVESNAEWFHCNVNDQITHSMLFVELFMLQPIVIDLLLKQINSILWRDNKIR